MKIIGIFLTGIMLFSVATSVAQSPRGTVPAPAAFKPPKLTTTLGNFKDSSATDKIQAAAALGAALRVTDAKGTVYKLSSYQFAYRQLVVTEDDSMSGKRMVTSAIKSSLFTSTPLPPLWIKLVDEDLRPGEELYFFAVTAKDPQGHVMYAPDLKVIIK